MTCARPACGHEDHADGRYECLTPGCECLALVVPVPKEQRAFDLLRERS